MLRFGAVLTSLRTKPDRRGCLPPQPSDRPFAKTSRRAWCRNRTRPPGGRCCQIFERERMRSEFRLTSIIIVPAILIQAHEELAVGEETCNRVGVMDLAPDAVRVWQAVDCVCLVASA